MRKVDRIRKEGEEGRDATLVFGSREGVVSETEFPSFPGGGYNPLAKR